jgi:four helix bundle protein
MGNHRDLDVLDAADQLAQDVNKLIDSRPRRLIHVSQLRKSAQAIGSNISEGFGRATDGERKQGLRVARGEAEETIRHLQANYNVGRIEARTFWRLKNRLVTIIKMLTALLNR